MGTTALKKSQRDTVLRIRNNLDDAQRAELSAQVIYQVTQSPLFHAAKKIAFYMPVRQEVDLTPLITETWLLEKSVFLPTLAAGNVLTFVSYTPDSELVKNQYGILEPATGAALSASMLHLVLVPLVAFDNQGNRLGMGAGFYDRTFAFKRNHSDGPQLMGVGYDFQELTSIAHNAHDVPLDGVITPTRCIQIR